MADRQPATTSGNRRLGRYELIAEIARGGMGTVLLARLAGAGGFQRLFAVKLLHKFYADDSEFVEMLLDEARIAARIHHPNVVSIQEVEQSREHGYYLVMDYVEGFTLWDLSNALVQSSFKQRARIVIRIVLDALNGLEAAHTLLDDEGRPLGVVHRDVSPQNILVAVNGIARVTDFGIAKAATRMTTTRVGQVKGKLAYMAPEQAKGQSLDTRADVWAVAVVLWESLTGRRLFKGANDSDTYRRVLNSPVPRLNEMFAEAPPALSDLILRALERDAARRIASAREFSQSLEAVARAHSLLADPHEISGWIRERFASELATRREAIKQAAAGDLGPGEKFAALPGGINIPQLPEKSISLTVSPRADVSATADVDLGNEPSSVTKRETSSPGGDSPSVTTRQPDPANDESPSVTTRHKDVGLAVPRAVPQPGGMNPAEFDEVFDTVVVQDEAPATEAVAKAELIAAARAIEEEEFDDQSTSRMDPENMSPGVKAAILAARNLMASRPKATSGSSADVDDNRTTEQGRNPLGPRPVKAAVAPAPMSSMVPTHPMQAIGHSPAPITGPVATSGTGPVRAQPSAASGGYAAAQMFNGSTMPGPGGQQPAIQAPMPMPMQGVHPSGMHAAANQAPAMPIGNAPTLAAFVPQGGPNAAMPPGGWGPSNGPTMPPPYYPGSPQVGAGAMAAVAGSTAPVVLEPMRRSPVGLIIVFLLLAALGAGLGYFVWMRQSAPSVGSGPLTSTTTTPTPTSVGPSSPTGTQTTVTAPAGPAGSTGVSPVNPGVTPSPGLPVMPNAGTPAVPNAGTPAATNAGTPAAPNAGTPAVPTAGATSAPSSTQEPAANAHSGTTARPRGRPAAVRRPSRNIHRAPPPRRRPHAMPVRRRSGGVIDTPPM